MSKPNPRWHLFNAVLNGFVAGLLLDAGIPFFWVNLFFMVLCSVILWMEFE